MFSAVFSLMLYYSPFQAGEQTAFFGKTVDGWRELIRSRSASPDERREALWALGCFGPDAGPAVPDLMELVHEGHFKDEATGTLIVIGARPEVTVPPLIARFLKEGCLHRTGQGTIFFNPGPEDAIVRIGAPAVPALINILQGPNRDMRVCAAAALGRIGHAARPAIPALIHAAESPENDYLAQILKRDAIIALGEIGPEARAIAPTLKRLLERNLKGERDWTGPEEADLVTALNKIGAPPVAMLVDKLLQGDDPHVAFELAGLGSNARESIPALRRSLSDKRPNVRVPAAIALAEIDPAIVEAIPVLTEALTHPENEIVDFSWVIGPLAKLGPKARAALPSLIALLGKGCDADLCKALVQIDPEGREAVPALISVLRSKDYGVVHTAAHCLGLLGPRAKDAVPALAAVLTREFGEIFPSGYEPQASAARALRRIEPAAPSAIPALIRALKFRDRVGGVEDGFNGRADWSDCTGAAAAAEALGSFGAESRIAVPALIEAVQRPEKEEEDWMVRLKSIEALGQIGSEARPAIPVLRGLMNECKDHPQFLPVILAALYSLAPDGKELAMRWLDAPVNGRFTYRMRKWVEGRAMLMGRIGRTSGEADYLIRLDLLRLDRIFASADTEADDPPMPVAEWFERLGRFGVGGRKAIPRLRQFQKHPSPWVRMWTTEALLQITAKPRSVSFLPPSGRR
jgi:HEAT repeat protein